MDAKQAEADTATLNVESAKEVVKSEKEIEVKKVAKAKKVASEKPTAADLEKPWGTPSEVWTANMPAHHFEAQVGRKEMKEHELAQAEESEEESEDEDSGDESDE